MSIPVPDHIARAFDDTETSVTVDTNVADAEVVNNLRYAGGSVIVPAASSITSLTFYICHTPGGTYVPYSDQDGVAVVLTVAASNGYALPDALFGAPFFKMVGNADGVVSIFRKG